MTRRRRNLIAIRRCNALRETLPDLWRTTPGPNRARRRVASAAFQAALVATKVWPPSDPETEIPWYAEYFPELDQFRMVRAS